MRWATPRWADLLEGAAELLDRRLAAGVGGVEAVVGILIIGAIILDRVLAVRQHRRLVAEREGVK